MFVLLTDLVHFIYSDMLIWGLFSSGSKYFSYWQSKTLTSDSTKYDTNISPLVCHLKKNFVKKNFVIKKYFMFMCSNLSKLPL